MFPVFNWEFLRSYTIWEDVEFILKITQKTVDIPIPTVGETSLIQSAKPSSSSESASSAAYPLFATPKPYNLGSKIHLMQKLAKTGLALFYLGST